MPRSKVPSDSISQHTEGNELIRVAHVAFQLEALSKQLSERNESQAKHEARLEQKFETIEKKLD